MELKGGSRQYGWICSMAVFAMLISIVLRWPGQTHTEFSHLQGAQMRTRYVSAAPLDGIDILMVQSDLEKFMSRHIPSDEILRVLMTASSGDAERFAGFCIRYQDTVGSNENNLIARAGIEP